MLRGRRWGQCVRSRPSAERGRKGSPEKETAEARSGRRQKGGRCLSGAQATAQTRAQAQEPCVPRGRQEGDRGLALGPAGMRPREPRLDPTHCGLLGDPGILAVGPPEAPPPALASVVPEDVRSPGAGRGAPGVADAIPGLLRRATGPEPGFEAQLCSVAPGPDSATRSGVGWPRPATSSSSPSPPRAHSRVSLPPIPLR